MDENTTLHTPIFYVLKKEILKAAEERLAEQQEKENHRHGLGPAAALIKHVEDLEEKITEEENLLNKTLMGAQRCALSLLQMKKDLAASKKALDMLDVVEG